MKHSSYVEFHKEVLDLFIPAKRLLDLFYHPQGHREKFRLFGNDIKEASQVLLINKMELIWLMLSLKGCLQK